MGACNCFNFIDPYCNKFNCYVNELCNEFWLSQKIDEFESRLHYRVKRNLFEIPNQQIYGSLRLHGTGQYNAIEPHRQPPACL